MKKLNNKLTIVTLFFMICNFFIVPIANVFAESSTAVDDYISDMNSKSNAIDSNFMSSKNSLTYINNSSFKYAVDSFYNEYNLFKNNYDSYINNIGDSISVRKVLVDSNSPLLDEFDSKKVKSEVVYFKNVQDVIYHNSETDLDEILITGTSLAELINKTYFLVYYNKYDDFLINYDSHINEYQSYYDQIINDYNESKNIINNYILEINEFIKDEQEKGNKPNVLYKGTNIIDSLNSCIKQLDISLNKVLSTSYNNDFDSTVNDATNIKDSFFENNKNITSDLTEEINSLTNKYKCNYDQLSDLFKSVSIDISSIDYSLIKIIDKDKISEFISLFEDIYILNKEYTDLNKKIDSYLNRMPSESSLILNSIDDLNSYYENLNKEKLLDLYNNFVYNANLSDENIIDSLLLFDYLSDKQYEYLMNVKKSFYNISLIDDSKYKINITKNYLIINGLDNIKKSSFYNNLTYNGIKYELIVDSDILDKNTVLKLYDRNGLYLCSLNIIIKNDVNGDGLVNNKDVSLLKNKVLYQKFNNYDKIASDINNDNVLNINDLVELNKIVNKITESKGDKSSFKIFVNETFEYVTYNIYLNTNGVVNGFEFNIMTSSNLKFVKAITGNGVKYFNNNGIIRVLGLGTYKDNYLVLKVTFKKNLNSNKDIRFMLKNGIILFDNLGYNDNLNYKNIIKYKCDKEEIKLDNLKQISSINNLHQKNITIDKKDNILSDTSEKSKVHEENLNNQDIAWNNVIKIAIIVLLGALIIYFLNKDSEVDFEENTNNQDENINKK